MRRADTRREFQERERADADAKSRTDLICQDTEIAVDKSRYESTRRSVDQGLEVPASYAQGIFDHSIETEVL